MKSKKVFFCSIIVIIFLICFFIIYYNFCKTGNNNHKKFENRTVEEIINNIQNYYAEVEIEVTSNKTVNVYDAKEYVNNNESVFETIDGKIKITNKDGKIIIDNKNYINTKEYKIKDEFNNDLFLITAIKELEEICSIDESKIEISDTENLCKLKFKNTYGIEKEISYNKIQKIPISIEIRNDVQSIKICIKYKYIELNSKK